MFKTFQIAYSVPLIIGGQHGFETGGFESFDEVVVDIQRDTLDPGIGGGKTADAAPFTGKIIPLGFGKSLSSLLEPKVDVFLIHVLIHKTAFIDQWNNRTIVHTILNGILVNQLSKLGHGVFLFFHKRCAGKTDVAGIGEDRAHASSQQSIVGTMTFVHQEKDIPGQILVLQLFCRVELVDNGGDHIGTAILQQVHQIASAGGPGGIQTGVREGGGNLTIQLFAVSNDDDPGMA